MGESRPHTGRANPELIEQYRLRFYERLADQQAQDIDQFERKHEKLNEDVSEALKQLDAHQANLALGRQLGVKARKESAQKRREQVDKAIDDLFDKPDKPGWRWTIDEITDFLSKRFAREYKYKRSTIKQFVKLGVARHRKAEKTRQANQFPVR